MQNSFNIVAHRGLTAHFPENTLLSYEKAMAYPIDMLEIDVHMTRDGQLVLIHDDTIDRTSNGTGKIKDMDLATLQTFDYGRWEDPDFQVLPLPLLSDALALAKQHDVTLLIELKKPQQYPGLIPKLLEVIEESGIDDERIIIQSFDHEAIQKVAEYTHRYALGYLISYTKYKGTMPDFEAMAKVVRYANPNFLLVDDTFVKAAHHYGLSVLPYTVNTQKDVAQMRALGVDGIISDCVDQWLDKKK